MNAPGVKHICRAGFQRDGAQADYPLSNKFDEVDTLMILDDVLIPWEDVLFYQHTRAAAFIRATLHRYSAMPFVQRLITYADMMIGAALWNVKQTGLENQPAVQEKLAQLAVYREGINAHLTAAITLAERSPGGFLMPNPVLADDRPGTCDFQSARDDAYCPRVVWRPDLYYTRYGFVQGRGNREVAG